MFRSTLFAALVGLGLVTWGATPSLAQVRPQPQVKPAQPQLKPAPPQPLLKQQALLVIQVVPGSTADRQGLEAGDIIVGVNGNPVRSLADLNHWVGRAGRVAQLDVIDGNTGWLNQVLVYPRNGKIGVVCQVVPLDNFGPGNPGVRPMPLPMPPGRPGIQPIPVPLPGSDTGFFPGR
jgi:hypothetical protein